jgi:hypothetical protein
LAQPLNIIVFRRRHHGAKAYGAYGNTVVKTRDLDQLAAEGVRFPHAFLAAVGVSLTAPP